MDVLFTSLFGEVKLLFQNIGSTSVIPFDEIKAYLGIVFLGGAILSGCLFVQRLWGIKKKKPIELPPAGVKYEQVRCPHCYSPNIVYPPLKKYTEIVFDKCKDKQRRKRS